MQSEMLTQCKTEFLTGIVSEIHWSPRANIVLGPQALLNDTILSYQRIHNQNSLPTDAYFTGNTSNLLYSWKESLAKGFKNEAQRRIDKVSHIEQFQSRLEGIRKEKGKLEDTVNELTAQKNQLQCELGEAERSVRKALQNKEICALAAQEAESQLRSLQGPVEEIKAAAQEEFNSIKDLFETSVRALRILDKGILTEIRSYPNPAQPIVDAMFAVMMVMGKEESWHNVMIQLHNPNFIDDLLFFDHSTLTRSTFAQLNKRMIENPHLCYERAMFCCFKLPSIILWLRAIQNFGLANDKLVTVRN
ncbi:dynein heavy chain domain 1 [Cichlidogyrus casuarinus]|uniref:Dynein heavy chain domain 1 n=1 Tax=Cichlidogyrus casuarinus TaxID=1844966 RepID=A0ABD2PXC9_9PLAT